MNHLFKYDGTSKIAAIKAIREVTGAGLMESKTLVEANAFSFDMKSQTAEEVFSRIVDVYSRNGYPYGDFKRIPNPPHVILSDRPTIRSSN